jgi:aryl-alcohol dehydrogenase-like predicted oxidoreductase
MEPVQLGRSGLRVSPLSLGTMTFGATAAPDVARRIANRALDAGVFAWDTADMYGSGTSEQIVGELLKGRRERVVLATKAFATMGPGANDGGLSARHLIAACDASLKRLGTDWIDLYYLHLPDRSVPLEETLRAMEDLVRSGRVRYVGCSNYRAWEVAQLHHTAEGHGWQPVSATQPLYNIANRDIEVELLPMAQAYGLGVITYSPLARGVLTGKYAWGSDAPGESRLARSDKRFLQAEWREASVRAAEVLAGVASSAGMTPTQLAIRWTVANTLISSVILGVRTEEQLVEQLAAMDFPWTDALEAAVDAVVPPGSHTGEGWPDPAYYPVRGRVL